MRALSFAAVVVFASTLSSEAQTRQFPYEAIVVQDGAYMRSGKGEKYYATGRLAKGRRVSVHRHDPGGWYMIAPPKGSFSWVPKRYVRVIRSGVGEISEEGVVAWVGTDFGPEASVFQRRLSVGQQVEIIGEAQIEVDRDRGPEAMLKIKPPRREYRWVPGQAVISADEAARGGGFDSFDEPAATPKAQREPTTGGSSSGFLGDRPTSRRRSTGSTRSNLTGRRDLQMGNNRTTYDSAKINQDRAQLEQLDNLFRATIKKPKSQWDFRELEAGYLQLKQNAAHPALASQVSLRLPALRRYQKTKARYDEFVSLTSGTTQRDRELTRMASGQNGMSPPAAEILPPPPRSQQQPLATPQQPFTVQSQRPLVEEAPALPAPLPAVAGNGNGGQSFPAPSSGLPETGPIVPVPGVVQAGNPNAKPSVSDPLFDPPQDRTGSKKQEPVPPGMTRVRQWHPDFCGAGVVMKSTDLDVPEYVLLAPNGKILAYLDAVGGFDLSKHVASGVGIKGDRFHNPKWKADYIKVRSAEAINLKN